MGNGLRDLVQQVRGVHRSKSGPLMSALGQSLPIDMTATRAQCPLHLQ